MLFIFFHFSTFLLLCVCKQCLVFTFHPSSSRNVQRRGLLQHCINMYVWFLSASFGHQRPSSFVGSLLTRLLLQFTKGIYKTALDVWTPTRFYAIFFSFLINCNETVNIYILWDSETYFSVNINRRFSARSRKRLQESEINYMTTFMWLRLGRSSGPL